MGSYQYFEVTGIPTETENESERNLISGKILQWPYHEHVRVFFGPDVNKTRAAKNARNQDLERWLENGEFEYGDLDFELLHH